MSGERSAPRHSRPVLESIPSCDKDAQRRRRLALGRCGALEGARNNVARCGGEALVLEDEHAQPAARAFLDEWHKGVPVRANRVMAKSDLDERGGALQCVASEVSVLRRPRDNPRRTSLATDRRVSSASPP